MTLEYGCSQRQGLIETETVGGVEGINVALLKLLSHLYLACGTVIGQVNSGQCFKYKGTKSSCTLDGKQHEFFELEYESGSVSISLCL